MRYSDPLYGEWELPCTIEKISRTKEMVRLRNITQSVLPNTMMPFGPMPSRFHHGLGVARLAEIVLEHNPALRDYQIILPIAALLHDAGNPPFTHISEYFLKEITGKDGESFLENILDKSETEKILKEYNISNKEIIRLVTGAAKPFSEILNGSLDIDNLDNVERFNRSAGLRAAHYNAVRIASSFRWTDDGWALDECCFPEIKKWQLARIAAYHDIYGVPHLNVGMMVYRAVEIAFYAGELMPEFFFLDDTQATEYLLTACNPKTARLVERSLRWDWYEEVCCIETSAPPEKLVTLAGDFKNRKVIADMLSQELRVPEEAVLVYIGKGRDVRNITIPFVDIYGRKRCEAKADRPIYRLKVYMPPECAHKKEREVTQTLLHKEIF